MNNWLRDGLTLCLGAVTCMQTESGDKTLMSLTERLGVEKTIKRSPIRQIGHTWIFVNICVIFLNNRLIVTPFKTLISTVLALLSYDTKMMTCSIFLGSLCVAAWVQPSRRQAQSAPHSQISSHATCFQTTRSIHWRSSTEFAWAVTTGRGRQRCMLSVWTTRGKNISQLWINTEKLFIWDLFGRVSDSIHTLACYLKELN